MDVSLPKEDNELIRTVLGRFTSAEVAWHRLLTREAGNRRFMQFDLLVPGEWTVQRGHDLVEDITEALWGTRVSPSTMPPARLKRRKCMSTALLLVDELGFEPLTRQEASLFFRLVSYRYGRGAMLITTNKSVRDWTELLAGDEVLATAILDRLLHRSHVLNIKGRSYRLRDLEDALKLARA